MRAQSCANRIAKAASYDGKEEVAMMQFTTTFRRSAALVGAVALMTGGTALWATSAVGQSVAQADTVIHTPTATPTSTIHNPTATPTSTIHNPTNTPTSTIHNPTNTPTKTPVPP